MFTFVVGFAAGYGAFRFGKSLVALCTRTSRKIEKSLDEVAKD